MLFPVKLPLTDLHTDNSRYTAPKNTAKGNEAEKKLIVDTWCQVTAVF